LALVGLESNLFLGYAYLISSAAAMIESSSVTSIVMGNTAEASIGYCLSASNCWIAASALSGEREPSRTWYLPELASCCAMANPIPWLAPVTRTSALEAAILMRDGDFS